MKISIITVTRNSALFINDCLASVKRQKYNDIEHIIIDGASTDETLKLLELKREQLKTVISEPDKGIYDAMNKGIRIATGDIIGFLNSDDFYANNEVLSKVASILATSTTEAELISAASCSQDVAFCRKLANELGFTQTKPTVL